jgi:hypothetical protein
MQALGNVQEEYIDEAAAVCSAERKAQTLSKMKLLLLAAVLSLLLMGAGFAAVVYGESIQGWFGHHWEAITGREMSSAQVKLINHLSQELDLTQTVGKISVRADSATVGESNFYLLLRVEGMDFSSKYAYSFEEIELLLQPDPIAEGSGLRSCGLNFHGIDGDGAVLLLIDCDYANQAGQQTDTTPLELQLSLKDFSQDPRTDRRVLLQEGSWEFDITLDRSKPIEKITVPDAEVLALDLSRRDQHTEMPVLLKNIVLSATNVSFQYDFQDGSLDLSPRVKAILKDGRSIGSGGGLGTILEESGELFCTHSWQIPIAPEEVRALLIGDTEIPVG